MKKTSFGFILITLSLVKSRGNRRLPLDIHGTAKIMFQCTNQISNIKIKFLLKNKNRVTKSAYLL